MGADVKECNLCVQYIQAALDNISLDALNVHVQKVEELNIGKDALVQADTSYVLR